MSGLSLRFNSRARVGATDIFGASAARAAQIQFTRPGGRDLARLPSLVQV